MAAPHTLTDPADAKQAARARATAARAGCDPSWGSRLAGHVLERRPPPPGAVVSGFWPMAGEIDLRPLLLALIGRGHAVVLPVTPPRGRPLLFRRWQPGAVLRPGPFGVWQPTGEIMIPDFLLVPLLAFDGRGHRLGYGGGYYDRTLAGLPVAARLGCAFAAQELDAVPVGPYDIALPAVATECCVRIFGER